MDRLREATTLTLLACLGLLVTAGGAAASAKKPEMGDAPDGGATRYAKPGAATGAFPSTLANLGPRHASWALRLGRRANGERDSRQVDIDRFDDGAEATLRRCSAKSRLELGLNGRRLSAKQRAKGNVIYVNAWFDWNRDGDWDDATDGCAPEWAIRNLAIPASSLGSDRVRLLPIGFKAGKQTRELWWRVTVTLNEQAADPSGGGGSGYRLGETEDYLHRGPAGRIIFPEPPEEPKEKKNPKLTVKCAPGVAIIPHGGTARIGFKISAPGKGGPVYGAFRSPRKGKGFRTGLIRHRNQRGLAAGKVRAVGYKLKSTDIDGPVRFQVVATKFVFKRGATVRNVKCFVLIVHQGKARGKKHGKHKHQRPPKIPVVHCRGACAGKGSGGQTTGAEGGGSPPPEIPPPVSGQGKITNTFGNQVNFQLDFNSPLNRFLLFFDGFQVVNGAAKAGADEFKCTQADFGGKPFSALSCEGPIAPGVPIEGGLILNPEPPGGVAPQLFGYSGATQYGPFPVSPPGP